MQRDTTISLFPLVPGAYLLRVNITGMGVSIIELSILAAICSGINVKYSAQKT
jgi:hypothetical protein